MEAELNRSSKQNYLPKSPFRLHIQSPDRSPKDAPNNHYESHQTDGFYGQIIPQSPPKKLSERYPIC
jgi:hypothetical protein